jgi:hypothetical protein
MGALLFLKNKVLGIHFGSTSTGEFSVHQAEPPYLARLQYNREGAWYPRGRCS